MQKLTIFMVLTIIASVALARPELKGSPEELRQFLHPTDKVVTLYGHAEAKAYSDKAIISLVITTEDKLLSESIAKNSDLRAAITTQLVDAGIKQENIKSSKFSTSPQYGWFGKQPDSYKVVNRMAVSIVDESQLKKIATIADAKAEVELADITFEHTQKDEYNAKVKAQALAKIMQQKQFYTNSLGVKLTPIGFRDTHIGYRATPGARVLEQAVLTKSRGIQQDAPAKMLADHGSRPSAFDEIQYTAEIYVDFKIEAIAE